MTTAATTRQADFAVEGMTCGSCAARVQRVLSRQAGVERADVNLATARARVVYRPGGRARRAARRG